MLPVAMFPKLVGVFLVFQHVCEMNSCNGMQCILYRIGPKLRNILDVNTQKNPHRSPQKDRSFLILGNVTTVSGFDFT